jgi:hypothetical protein
METLRTVLSRAVAFALVLFVVGGSTAWAGSGSASFVFLAASGPTCSLPPLPPSQGGAFCPDVTRAANGDTIEITGAGTLSIFPKSVAGGGTFTHKNPAGGIIAFGVWTAKELLSFHDFGTAVPFFPPNVHGGLAIMRVHLTPSTGGAGVDAILEVDCAINQPGFNFEINQPGFNADVHKNPEGIRLAVEGGPNFNEKVSGFTVFIAI